MRTPTMNIKQTAITEHIILQKCLYKNEKTFISNVYLLLFSNEHLFQVPPYKMDFFQKSPHVLLSNFQSILFLLLRVSGRKIGRTKKKRHPCYIAQMPVPSFFTILLSQNIYCILKHYFQVRVAQYSSSSSMPEILET